MEIILLLVLLSIIIRDIKNMVYKYYENICVLYKEIKEKETFLFENSSFMTESQLKDEKEKYCELLREFFKRDHGMSIFRNMKKIPYMRTMVKKKVQDCSNI